ncbi:MAG: 2-polyprenyl-3-methyl-6-methoxy-1,4-benzoquinone monooxygenase [Gammaproteobacteria bacterium]|nr:2-polyprenyl-3-methyl-6-methoxy-1,4-benzoquinone monooxygenase [Gammaproteobacteria bacterium]MDH3466337.1 2-polyprenyl-3-methyl-6-methoxy-1,4-benzoquinone monooxygenase [Gammaproteobacteria bacterium]
MRLPDSATELCDRLILGADQALRTIFADPADSGRPDPSASTATDTINDSERRKAARLMRVNHSGEVCAQALYQGQATTSRNPELRRQLQRASDEENDHLRWCAGRLQQLQANKSLLNPFWYASSFILGATAGALGDRWNLGFLAETENQVVAHLDDHLTRLPESDYASRAILEQMKQDEAGHATEAVQRGAATLPAPVRGLMRIGSRLMTQTTYWI